MSKVFSIVVSVLLVTAIGTTGYFAKKHAFQKDAVAACEKTVETLREELAATTTESRARAQRLDEAKRQHQGLSKQLVEIKRELTEYQENISKRDDELQEQQRHCQELSKQLVETKKELTEYQGSKSKLDAELQEQERKYQSLIANLKKEMQSKEITISRFRERLNIEMVNRILFGNGSTRITATGRELLGKVGTALRDLKENFIFVMGHTDTVPIGPDLLSRFPSNWELSSARSASVVRYLVETAGVDPGRCVVVGRSFYSPLAANETEEGRRQNRRAEIIIAKSLDFAVPYREVKSQ